VSRGKGLTIEIDTLDWINWEFIVREFQGCTGMRVEITSEAPPLPVIYTTGDAGAHDATTEESGK
jgi:hypothetical protein